MDRDLLFFEWFLGIVITLGILIIIAVTIS